MHRCRDPQDKSPTKLELCVVPRVSFAVGSNTRIGILFIVNFHFVFDGFFSLMVSNKPTVGFFSFKSMRVLLYQLSRQFYDLIYPIFITDLPHPLDKSKQVSLLRVTPFFPLDAL